jgi:hypothetical protein
LTFRQSFAGGTAFPVAPARRLLSHQAHEEQSEFLEPQPITAEEAMTTSSLKPTTLTSQNGLRTAAAAPLRESNRRAGDLAPRSRPAGAARRFLSVLMNSFSAWAV